MESQLTSREVGRENRDLSAVILPRSANDFVDRGQQWGVAA